MESDVERSIAQPALPLHSGDVHSSSIEGGGGIRTPARSSTPSTIHEDYAHNNRDEKDLELALAVSTAQSVYPPPVKVPSAKRRGLFARFSMLAEVEEPKHYPRKTKWFITFIIALAAIAAPLGSAIILRERHSPLDRASCAMRGRAQVCFRQC